MIRTLKRGTARRRYTPVYTHSGGASGRSEWEALPGMCLVGPSTAARKRCLGLWSGLRLGGSPRNRCLLQRHRAFPWSAVQRSASYRSLRKGVCRTLGPRPGKLATDALQVLSLRGKPSRSSPTSHPLNLTNKQKTHTKWFYRRLMVRKDIQRPIKCIYICKVINNVLISCVEI